MKKIATENSIVVLTPSGAWSWAGGRQLNIPVTGSPDAPFTVNGEPVLLEKNVVDVLKAGIPKQMYRHCDAATDCGGIASADVRVENDSLSQRISAAESKLVTSETSGTFSIRASKPSSVNGTPDPVGQHTGSWRVKDARQTICTEGAISPSSFSFSSFRAVASGEDTATNRKSSNQASDEVDEVRIWMKAFIPNEHPDKELIRQIPGRKNRWMLNFLGACFETDHRGFSDDPVAEARVTTDFTLRFDGTKAEVSPSNGTAHQPGRSRLVECDTGKLQKEAAGEFSSDGRALESPRVADGSVQIKGEVSIRNPFIPLGSMTVKNPFESDIGVFIDYSFDLEYEKDSGILKCSFKVGTFPAFEAYVSLNGSPAREVLTVQVGKETPVDLFDFGRRVNTKSYCREMVLKESAGICGASAGADVTAGRPVMGVDECRAAAGVRKRSDVKGGS